MMLRWLDQGLRFLLTALAFFGFAVGGLLLSLVLIPLLRLAPGDRAAYGRRCRWLTQQSYRLFHAYMRAGRLVDYRPDALHLDLPAGGCVLIANHPTLIDVTAILAAVGEAACVVKHAHFQGPLHFLMRGNWHIDGGDGGPTSGAAVVLQAVERLRTGLPVLIFPEGTRSPEGGLNRFQRGAFEIARRAQVPVVPLRVTCDPPILAKEAPWYRVPVPAARLRIEQLPTQWPDQAPDSTKTWAADCEAMYRQRLPAPSPHPQADLALAANAAA